MKISACYIVKNEAAVLERSIVSLRGCADEILVVDTGSTDAAPQIAARCGAGTLSDAAMRSPGPTVLRAITRRVPARRYGSATFSATAVAS